LVPKAQPPTKSVACCAFLGHELRTAPTSFHALLLSTHALRRGKSLLRVANAIWPHRRFRLESRFAKLMRRSFFAKASPLDYDKPKRARTIINRWAARKTKQHIKQLIPKGSLSSLVRMVLTNAIYFKGTWKHKFKGSDTRDAPFYLDEWKSVQVKLMRRKGRYRYLKEAGYQVVELPYEGKALGMLLVVPNKRTGLSAVEKKLKALHIASWRKRMRTKKLRLFLPRLTMRWGRELSQTLKAMGMKLAFDHNKADFSKMLQKSAGVAISKVIHKAYVQVNELGTVAAAATAVVAKGRGRAAPIPIVRADHPFFFRDSPRRYDPFCRPRHAALRQFRGLASAKRRR
jgi:serpin B